MDKNKIQQLYRQEHPNCKWCVWYKYHSPSTKMFIDCPDFIECTLKEKIIHFPRLKAKLCNQYYVEEENDEV